MTPSARIVAVLAAIAAFSSCSPGGARMPTYSGTIEAVEVDVVPEVPGRILERPVDEGSRVAAGDVIARIDPESFRNALAETEAALDTAKASLALLTRGYRPEEIDAAAREVDQAKAQVALAGTQVGRAERLVADHVRPEEDLDIARRDLDVAKAQLQAATARYDLVHRGYRKEDVDRAAAEVRRLEAQLEQRRLDLRRTTVVSPLAGTVTEKLQEPGEYARVGSPIVTVADLENLYTWVYLSTLELPHIEVGRKVSVRIDAFPGEDFPGSVAYISPVAEFTPKNVQTVEDRVQLVFGVKVAVPNPDGRLKIGIPADVVLNRPETP